MELFEFEDIHGSLAINVMMVLLVASDYLSLQRCNVVIIKKPKEDVLQLTACMLLMYLSQSQARADLRLSQDVKRLLFFCGQTLAEQIDS